MTEPLSESDIQELRGQLQLREKQLLAELEEGRRRAASEPFGRIAGEVPDAGDASVADLEIDGASAERARDADELRDIREALTRIESGTYGICLECGEPIARERLRAFPSARYDLHHQAQRERDLVRTPTL
jgi:DnaK suppressor protein